MEMDNTRICVGIDLGTTNTSAAYSIMRTDGTPRPEKLPIRQREKIGKAQRRFDVLPSILYLKENGEIIVGREAQDYKDNDIRASGSKPRFLENVKRYMGTQTTFQIDEKTFTPIDVATTLLEYVKQYSDIRTMTSDYYTVITVPANFNTDQRSDTIEAAKRAGFTNIELYDEPKAAILSFLHEETEKLPSERVLDLTNKKRILVIDIGGGTCDICVEDVVIRDDQFVFSHMAVGRDNLGGVDFDQRVGDELAKMHLSPDTVLTAADISSLRNLGEQAKKDLSDLISEEFIWSCYDGHPEALYEQDDCLDILEENEVIFSQMRKIGNRDITFHMGIRDFVNAITPLIYDIEENPAADKEQRERSKNMETLINTTLADHNIDVDSIDVIFLTGGMAKCFPLRASLYGLYQKPIISPEDPLLAVSNGAALFNKYRSIDETSKDLMPNAIMLEMQDGTLKTLVKMGEQIPVSKTVDEEFTVTSRLGVAFSLYEGKNEYDSQLRKLNDRYRIDFDKVEDRGRKFKVSYRVDKTKRITFTITFLDTGETYNIDCQTREGQ